MFPILVTRKNKAMFASFSGQKCPWPWRFPSLFLSSRESFSFLFLRPNNPPNIFVGSAFKSQTPRFTRGAQFAVKRAAIAFSSDCSICFYCWLWFRQTQTLSKVKPFSAWIIQKRHDSLFYISFRKMVRNVFWTGRLSTIMRSLIV